jgi:hypothetical protein
MSSQRLEDENGMPINATNPLAVHLYETASSQPSAVYDPYITLAEAEILNTYGDVASVWEKKKALFKFGSTENADSGVKTTVAQFQGAVVNETFATGNTVDSIVSDNASDTGVVVIEGHTGDGSGNFTFSVQEATLNGQTPVSLSTSIMRCNRAYAKDGTFAVPSVDLVGNVYIYDSTLAAGVTTGTPNTATATKCMIAAGNNQSRKAATTISSADYWIVTEILGSLERGSGGSAAADLDVECRKVGGVWRPMGLQIELHHSAEPNFEETFKPYRIIPPNTDVRMVATSDSANTQIAGHINGSLAIITS